MTILKLWSWRIWWRRYRPFDLIIWAVGFDHIWILKVKASNGMRATSWLADMELGAETRMMELTDSSNKLSRVRDKSRHLAEETRSNIRIRLSLGVDLNEIPSPSLHETLLDSFEVVWNFHDNPLSSLGGPTELPSVENDAGACNINHARRSSGACGACDDGCERGFHIGYTGARASRQVLSHDEWICMECECSIVKS